MINQFPEYRFCPVEFTLQSGQPTGLIQTLQSQWMPGIEIEDPGIRKDGFLNLAAILEALGNTKLRFGNTVGDRIPHEELGIGPESIVKFTLVVVTLTYEILGFRYLRTQRI